MRALTITPAHQLMLDAFWSGLGDGRDRERVWDQMPDAARTRVLRLLAAMIAAGVLADDGTAADTDTEAVRGDG